MLLIVLALAAVQPDPLMPEPPRLEVSRDAIDDRLRAVAIIPGRAGWMSIGCDPLRYQGLRVEVRSPAWLITEDVATRSRGFQYRFDRTPPWRSRWSTARRTAWLKRNRDTANFIRWAQVSRQVTVRTIDVEQRPVDLVFPLADARDEIDEALRLCSGARMAAAR